MPPTLASRDIYETIITLHYDLRHLNVLLFAYLSIKGCVKLALAARENRENQELGLTQPLIENYAIQSNTRQRPHEDDGPLGLLEVRERGLRHEEGRLDVQRERRLEEVGVHLSDGLVGALPAVARGVHDEGVQSLNG